MIALLTVVWIAAVAVVIGSLVYAVSRWVLGRDDPPHVLVAIAETYLVVRWIVAVVGGLFFIVLFGLALIAFLTNH